ncbi:FkbM family methyltransferase [Bythopirellula polymerisocia]|uniref:Methyltransferase FkbM domain-containing protein n=1 Tax=Bythopirellula polymerisocia TaxID=2528003 RepID=A0A5C6CNP5_9BACT|nr:FkbM family methyltransferase [Bythopirellula polymerisocia]TWU24676.1 hypothetical protein Pla144_35620 [Bythopirellula polymerisocia]
MDLAWKMLERVPPSLKASVKRCTSTELRLWLRDRLGVSDRSIPDKIVTVKDGRRFHIGPDYIYLPLFVSGEFEPAATTVVKRLLRKGDHVVDAGANYGWYTTLCAEIVGSKGSVYAFEPVPSTFDRLNEHITLNSNSDCVVAEQLALGIEQGETYVHLFNDLSHSRSSISNLGRNHFVVHCVPMTDLKSYLESRRVDHIDFLKCDVEGSELMVLQGAGEILDRVNAPIILIELNEETAPEFGYQPIDIVNYLRDRGYDSFYGIEAKNTICRIKDPQKVAKLNPLLCCKGDRIEKRMGS